MRLFSEHRPALISASLVAVLTAATVVPLAATADRPTPSDEVSAVSAPSSADVRAVTGGAVEAIEERESAAAARAEAEATAAAAAQDAADEAARIEAERAAAAEQAARTAERAAIDPRSAAQQIMSETYGWGEGQYQCLESLWTKESGWDHTAQNSSSGAYGIPQALPASKMASHGDDWQGNPVTQIRWGLDYINDVYGSPCAAWGHSQSVGWY